MTTATPDHPPNPEPAPEPKPTLIAERVAANRWRNSAQIRERLVKVAGLRQRGLSQAAIAGRLGVSEATISRDLRRLPLLWRQEHAHFVNAERLRIFAGLREAERLWWEAIEKPQDGRDPVALLKSATGSFAAIAREIRTLLKHAPPPQPEDYWGYSAIGRPPRDRVALEERYKPADKRVLGLLPYDDDPPDDDNPEQFKRYRAASSATLLSIAIEDGAGSALTDDLIESVISDLADARAEEAKEGDGASRNGAADDLDDDW